MKAFLCWLEYMYKGILGLAKYVLGIDPADKYQIHARRSVCQACRWQVKWYFGIRKCGSCGCFIVPKTAVGSEPCPQGRW